MTLILLYSHLGFSFDLKGDVTVEKENNIGSSLQFKSIDQILESTVTENLGQESGIYSKRELIKMGLNC